MKSQHQYTPFNAILRSKYSLTSPIATLVLLLLGASNVIASIGRPDPWGISSYPTLRESELFKRQSSGDVCNDAFPGRYSEICSPTTASNTLCCIIPNEDRPKCVSIFGYGWCCTEFQTCFVDVASTCEKAGSVSCNDEACCPQFTTCASNFNQTKELVRCEIQPALIPGVVSTSSTTTSTSTSTTSDVTSSTETSTNSETTTSSLPSSTSSSPSESSSKHSEGLKPEAIAGIVVGAILAILVGIGIGYLVFRRRGLASAPPGRDVVPPPPMQGEYHPGWGSQYQHMGYAYPYQPSDYGNSEQYKSVYSQELGDNPVPVQELHGVRVVSELGSRPRHEMH